MKKLINVLCVSLFVCAQAHAMDNQPRTQNLIYDEVLGLACRTGHIELVKYIIDTNANETNVNANHEYSLKKALPGAAEYDTEPICEELVEALLYIPNIEQKKKLVLLFGIDKYRKRLYPLGLDKPARAAFYRVARQEIYNQNKQDFKKSIAHQEINKLKDGLIKKHLLEKYEAPKQYCIVQ